jgi:drug/metabolite transporter (DMT)-like permease
MERSSLIGYFYIALAAVAFGVQDLLSGYLLSQNIPALPLTFLKTFFGIFIILGLEVFFRIRNFRIERKDIFSFILFGILGVGMLSYFLYVSINRTNITTAVPLMYTSGAFTIIMASYLLKERITRNKLISVAVTFVGILLVVVGYNVDQLVYEPLGILAGVGAGAAYGFYNVNSKKFIGKYNAIVINLYTVVFATIFLAFLANPVKVFTGGMIAATSWKFIILLSFVNYGVAFTLLIQGFKTVEAGRGAIIATIEPVMTVILARILFQESMGWVQGTGFVLIFTAIFIATRNEQKPHSIIKREEG